MECWWMHSDLNTRTMLKQSHEPSSRGGLLVLEGSLQHGLRTLVDVLRQCQLAAQADVIDAYFGT